MYMPKKYKRKRKIYTFDSKNKDNLHVKGKYVTKSLVLIDCLHVQKKR